MRKLTWTMVLVSVVASYANAAQILKPAQHAFVSGNQLWKLCNQTDKLGCRAYVVGVIDGQLSTVVEREPIYCLPPRVSSKQVVDVVVLWFKKLMSIFLRRWKDD